MAAEGHSAAAGEVSLSAEAQASARQHRALHFADPTKQAHAARLGMWLFLATEILLFAGLFVCYSFYRNIFHQEFKLASHHLDQTLGAIETVVLITSSLSVALAIHWGRQEKRMAAFWALIFTVAMGLLFVGLHSIEYIHEFHEGIYPGVHYHFAKLPFAGAAQFYTLYFLMTGLHGLHVTVGVVVLGWLAYQTYRGQYSEAYYTPLENGGMYWHLVDLIWIFLFPLLYLV